MHQDPPASRFQSERNLGHHVLRASHLGRDRSTCHFLDHSPAAPQKVPAHHYEPKSTPACLGQPAVLQHCCPAMPGRGGLVSASSAQLRPQCPHTSEASRHSQHSARSLTADWTPSGRSEVLRGPVAAPPRLRPGNPRREATACGIRVPTCAARRRVGEPCRGRAAGSRRDSIPLCHHQGQRQCVGLASTPGIAQLRK